MKRRVESEEEARGPREGEKWGERRVLGEKEEEEGEVVRREGKKEREKGRKSGGR